MSKLLEKRNSIYGVCALWIIIFHIFRKISMPYIPVITNAICIGNMAVDIFFFFSGLCLSLSVKKHDYPQNGWGGYYKRRLVRIILPYLIIGIPFYIWSAVFESHGGVVRKAVVFFANLSSASFWLKGAQATWYVHAIMVFYILFPLIYTFMKKKGTWSKLGLLLGFVLFAILTAYVPVLKNSMIAWARLPIFTIGVMAGTGQFKDREPRKTEMILAAAVVLLLGWLTSASELSRSFAIPQVYRLLLFIPLSLALLLLVSKIGNKIRALEWIGSLSLEIYLIHITLLHPLEFYGVISAVGYWLYLILPAGTLAIAWAVGKLEKLILKQGVGA